MKRVNLPLLAVVSLVVSTLLASCVPGVSARGASISVAGSASQAVGTLTLIVPRLTPPSGHEMPVITRQTSSSLTIAGRDLGYELVQGISQVQQQANPIDSPLLAGISGVLQSMLPRDGRYQVQVFVQETGDGRTIVSFNADNGHGDWLVDRLASELQRVVR